MATPMKIAQRSACDPVVDIIRAELQFTFMASNIKQVGQNFLPPPFFCARFLQHSPQG